MNESTSVHFSIRLRYIWFMLATTGWISQALLLFELILFICVSSCLNLCQCSTRLMSNLVERVGLRLPFLLCCIVCKCGLGDRKAVCLAITRVYCDKMNDSSAGNSYTIWKGNSSSFLRWRFEEWLVGDVPFYLKFWGQTDTVAAKTAIFNRYSLVVLHPLDLAKKKFSYH